MNSVKKDTITCWLVDDDPVANLINEQALIKKFNHIKPYTFVNPEEAKNHLLSLSKAEWPDYILLDLNMPLLEGWDFLEIMNAEGIRIPVILLTSSFYKEDQLRAKQFPQVIHFMTKPIKVRELKRVLTL